ncbi:MAG: transcriptional regulatory protein glnR [Actinomycetia bacterium]|nr:transcriptional regulatory protein glnR [Actinomycetes bacterium]MDQ1653085.1 hypothetical protein [Cryptosporangiaceae bacterium]
MTAEPLSTGPVRRGNTALPPWLPPRPDRARGGRSPARPRAFAGQPVTVAVEVSLSGEGAVALGAEIADQFRELAAALTGQAGSARATISAAIVSAGHPAAVPAIPPPEPNSALEPDPAPLRIDPSQRLVELDGRPVALTRREFDLLLFLAGEPGRVYTRVHLLRSVWGHAFVSGERTVDVHVRRLRAKLGSAGSFLGTVRGVGYRFTRPELVSIAES